MTNYMCFGGKFYLYYAYIDTYDYLCDPIFNKREVLVKFGNEYRRKDEKYTIIFCKIRKKYKEQFEKSMEELTNKMLILGHTDYEEYCNMVIKEMFGNAV